MRIVNGRFDDHDGKFTRMDTTGNSVVDYAIVCAETSHLIKHFKVHEDLLISDHFIIEITFTERPINVSMKQKGYQMYKYKWSQDDLPLLRQNLEESDCALKMEMFNKICMGEDVNGVANVWSEYLTSKVDEVFEKKICHDRFFITANFLFKYLVNL